MSKSIKISDALYAKLESLAIPFTDKEPEDVIERLVENYLANGIPSPATTNPKRNLPGLGSRTPRERGTIVKIGTETIHAATVPDLYQQVLVLVTKNGDLERLKPFIPFKTSKKRYLIANKAIHPQGNSFFSPVHHNGFFMEAHKSYRSAISDLAKLFNKIGVSVTYVG